MSSLQKKINKARENLSQGFHDPVIMEEIDILSDIISKCIFFEYSLLKEAQDID